MRSILVVVLWFVGCSASVSDTDGGQAGGSAGGGSAAGGSAAGGSAAGGSAAGGAAAGGAAGGGAAGGMALTITIDFNTNCPAIAPCASDPLGTWRYTSACINANDPYPALRRACAGLSFRNLSGTTRGQVEITQTRVTRIVNTSIAGGVDVPSACVLPLGGCAGVAASLRQTFATVSCTGTTTCSCTFTDVQNVNSTSPAVVATSSLVTDPNTSTARTWSFCQGGAGLTYQETSPEVTDPGLYGMTR